MGTQNELFYEALGDGRKIMVVEKTVVQLYCIEFNEEISDAWEKAVNNEDIPEVKKHNRITELVLNSYLAGKVDGHAGYQKTRITRPQVWIEKREPHHKNMVIDPDNFEGHGFSYDEIEFNGEDYLIQVESSFTEEMDKKYLNKSQYFDETDPDKW